MTDEAPHRRHMRRVTTTGTALASALLPLAVGVLLARTLATDPMAPVNALITGGQRASVPPSLWRGCGRTVLSGRRRPSGAGARPAAVGPAVDAVRAVRGVRPRAAGRARPGRIAGRGAGSRGVLRVLGRAGASGGRAPDRTG
ncbi:hypothetical protein [Streptomyces sp. SP18CS02]|uniref:hypothetical protein n=1 Tax=Streptomyces sp. SP18CS02 TaxID=3002531 RepID=UPI002E7A6CCF|nr:hypothetical protein [Streptomyces sp. SP18CS02]MEE1754634.1 hypothetical protein [Streptomyces sp. SP18CS02]